MSLRFTSMRASSARCLTRLVSRLRTYLLKLLGSFVKLLLLAAIFAFLLVSLLLASLPKPTAKNCCSTSAHRRRT